MNKVFFIFGLMLVVLSSCVNSSKLYDQALEKAEAGNPYDAVIVPGYPFDGTKWDDKVKGRVYWALHLYKNGLTRNVIFSGSAVYTPYVEAKIMALYAGELGIPAEHIFIEPRAQHSVENILYGRILAAQLGFDDVALATDNFQLSMSKSFHKRMKRETGLTISMLPIVTDSVPIEELHDPVIDPSTAHVEPFESIYESGGTFKRIKGTFGSGIDWDEERARLEKVQAEK